MSPVDTLEIIGDDAFLSTIERRHCMDLWDGVAVGGRQECGFCHGGSPESESFIFVGVDQTNP